MIQARFNILSFFFLLSLFETQNCPIQNCLDCSIHSLCLNCDVGFKNTAGLCSQLETYSQQACANFNDGHCTMCLIGYSLFQGTCVKCPSFCMQCTKTQICILCINDYSISNGDCISSQWIGCLVTFNDFSCSLCDEKFYLSTILGICQYCPNKCISCTNATNCQLCENGYYLSISKGATKCSPCSISCMNNCFGNSTNCTLCNINYYELIGECFPCQLAIPFCVTCALHTNYSNPICNICANQMFVSINGSCSRCPEGCISCANGTFCLSCNAKFFLNAQNLCQPCGIKNCLNCKQQSICESCVFNYFVSQTADSCNLCPNNCNSCNSETFCSQCISGYYINSISTCSPCILNCALCTPKTPLNCLNCNLGFYLFKEQSTNKCLPCPDYCPICQLNKNSFQCQFYCPSGFFLNNSDKLCIPCVNNCFNCNETFSVNQCALCNSGFYLTDQGQCSQCSEGCGLCQNISICKICIHGYFYENGQCLACSIKCNYCNSTTCLSCASGFYFSPQGQAQTQCQSCPIGCLSCQAENICNQCLSGYYLLSPSTSHSLFQICSPCLNTCSICSSNSSCIICQRGFSLNSNGQCIPCPNNFAFCDKEYGFKCLDRFTVILDVDRQLGSIIQKCIPCEIGCEKCQFYQSSLFCLQCSQGFLLTTGECFQCGMTNLTEGCLSCISFDICESCLSGFTLQNGQCINKNSLSDSSWPLIITDIALGCLLMILLTVLLIQRSQSKIKASSISMELTEGK